MCVKTKALSNLEALQELLVGPELIRPGFVVGGVLLHELVTPIFQHREIVALQLEADLSVSKCRAFRQPPQRSSPDDLAGIRRLSVRNRSVGVATGAHGVAGRFDGGAARRIIEQRHLAEEI
eukprot:SAG11_NODE_4707_length_1797_cov_1.153121_2_plen_122_part_00